MAGTRIQAAAASFLAAACALHPVSTPDLWWHLASGRWIVEHGEVPRHDVLSYTTTAHEWMNLQWLTDVALVRLWEWAGPGALVLAAAACVMLTAVALVYAARAAGAAAAAAGFASSLALLAGAERMEVRPEILSWAGLAVTLLVVHRVRSGRRRLLSALPPMLALWANLHSLAFLGASVLLLHALLDALEPRLPERLRDPAVVPGSTGALLLVGVAGTAAILVNPWGWRALEFPRTLLERIRGDVDVFGRILEFARPLDSPADPALLFAWIFAGVLALSFAALLPRVPLTRLLAVAPFLLLALLARRNVALFAVAAAPVLAVNLTEAARRFRVSLPGATAGLATAATAAVLGTAVLGGAAPTLFGIYRDPGLVIEAGLFPEESLAELDEWGVSGPVFHDLDFGGYLTWREPSRPSFIDGRLEVAGAEWLETYVRAHEDPAVWERVLQRWRPRALLLQHTARGNAAFLLVHLRDRRWSLADVSPEAVLFVESALGPARADLRPADSTWTRILAEDRGPAPGAGNALAFVVEPLHRMVAKDPSMAAVRRAVRYANACVTLGWMAEARRGYERVLEAAPFDPEAHFQLGVCDVREGRPEAARERWERALLLPRLDRESRDILRRALEELGPSP
ncbi:MAG: tetratricopeptide repeat protein [Candidatus Eiseniibacteriota bacterium]